ncbi:NADH pyrophosphatase [Microbotryomycetes sp. JL201]|nr:NADH pyrophosphatase [Microbotryomycetes sp. JL201]
MRAPSPTSHTSQNDMHRTIRPTQCDTVDLTAIEGDGAQEQYVDMDIVDRGSSQETQMGFPQTPGRILYEARRHTDQSSNSASNGDGRVAAEFDLENQCSDAESTHSSQPTKKRPRRSSTSPSYPTPSVSPKADSRTTLGNLVCRAPPCPPPLTITNMHQSWLISVFLTSGWVESAVEPDDNGQDEQTTVTGQGSANGARCISPELVAGLRGDRRQNARSRSVSLGPVLSRSLTRPPSLVSSDLSKTRTLPGKHRTLGFDEQGDKREAGEKGHVEVIEPPKTGSIVNAVKFAPAGAPHAFNLATRSQTDESDTQYNPTSSPMWHVLSTDEQEYLTRRWSEDVVETRFEARLHLDLDDFDESGQLRTDVLSSARVKDRITISDDASSGMDDRSSERSNTSSAAGDAVKLRSFETIGLGEWQNDGSNVFGLPMLPPRALLLKLVDRVRQDEDDQVDKMPFGAGNRLNRLSYLRSSAAFLTSALESHKAKFLLYDSLSPLVNKSPNSADGSSSSSSGGTVRRLVSVDWQDVKQYISADGSTAKDVFDGVDGKDDSKLGVVPQYKRSDEVTTRLVTELSPTEIRQHFIHQASQEFFPDHMNESSAPEEQQSLPVSKPTDDSTLESHSPYGIPYWALDVSNLTDLKKLVLERHTDAEFGDMRAGMQSIPAEDAAIGGEGRALIDWNRRNLFCPACGGALRSVWAGWKRTCVPGAQQDHQVEFEASDMDKEASRPACTSKKGVHNFNYPRTDPVCIMAITTPDRNQILLGRQKSWPPKFYSCLAGFIESGETIEESVRREVYEEAGIVVDEVFYHSSQPWPYPSSLMIGAIGVAKPGQTIRCDLDNELDDAQWFTREQVMQVINSSEPTQFSKEEVARLDNKSEHGQDGREQSKKNDVLFRMPPATAIANTLVHAWARNDYFGAQPIQNAPSAQGSNKL